MVFASIVTLWTLVSIKESVGGVVVHPVPSDHEIRGIRGAPGDLDPTRMSAVIRTGVVEGDLDSTRSGRHSPARR